MISGCAFFANSKEGTRIVITFSLVANFVAHRGYRHQHDNTDEPIRKKRKFRVPTSELAKTHCQYYDEIYGLYFIAEPLWICGMALVPEHHLRAFILHIRVMWKHLVVHRAGQASVQTQVLQLLPPWSGHHRLRHVGDCGSENCS